eukprot:TRINITY_DN76422_c0_g1_i1.p1 TRINITY_DN76422_c0_g1~~TRINITY_DN76422_c0_g1_i1.p1  ORF type:complete len:328 (+),score=88.06 TRINITY_DN76422_c0_g1_i1:34-1017(+)
MAAPLQPLWLARFRAKVPPNEVARAWLDGLSSQELEEAKEDAPAARARLREAIMSSASKEAKADGFVYVGAVLRAADALLGIQQKSASSIGGAASGDGAPLASRCVIEGGGQPGSLGIWWSDSQMATRPYELIELGITHRLNVAAEVALKDFDGLESRQVPMVDAWTQEKPEDRVAEWTSQLAEVLRILREWRDVGAKVNINCQMGKNRSAAAVLVWMCSECGWQLEEAVQHLRGITALACGNPYLLDAVAELLQVENNVPLNPAGDGGYWVCISPPGSPKTGPAAAPSDLQASLALASQELAALAGDREEENEEEAGDMEDLFAGI